MKQILYGDSSYTFRLEMPREWDVESLTAVTLTLIEFDGTELFSAAAATIYTATTLNGATSATDITATLDSGASAVAPGDRLRIAASAAGKAEDVEVDFYNSSTKVVSLAEEMRDAHSTGTAVYGMFATKAVDISGSSFAAGTKLIALWTPDTDDNPVRDTYEISSSEFAPSDIWRDMRRMYPTAWEVIQGRDLEGVADGMRALFDLEMRSMNIDIHRVVEREVLNLGFLKYARREIFSSGGDEFETEYIRADRDWKEWLETMRANTVLWQDQNDDNTVSDDEIDDLYPGTSIWYF